ncbi:Sugar lactone lactonase YvrE [Microbulbifer thermotolerans]|uniref:SMP-30/gluconolactonase/LRE family protein n=1 Tax=Microbulbifer thermotolerans TaxID=252514 RepID=UPI0008E85205|nr:SMP-30/gluconolactonase/LRE family protein [Microbulbifer thermotolerans]SFD13702.1 Sugar lactone lactonase YvrE [Microbulbifer thermotolerans]
MRELSAECVWPAGATLGEGPVWVARERAVYWVDIKEYRLHRYIPESRERASWRINAQVSALAPRAGGGFVCATRDGFALLFLDGGTARLEMLGGPEGDLPGNRFNDGKTDAVGRFWAGSMDDGERAPSGALYRLDTDLRWQRLDAGYVITNGPAFSPDGGTLYHTDTLRRRIYAFEVSDSGSLQNKRLFLQLPDSAGYPDGMTVDSEGCLWVCHWGGWGISRFSPGGDVVGRIALPVSNVTSCTFGGGGRDQLYITSARKGLSEAELERQPLAGGLFCCRPGVSGLETPLFQG